MRKLGLILLLGLASLAAVAGKHDDAGPVCNLNFLVVKDHNGQPLRNAAVILHQVGEKGKQEKGGLELKTDPDGKANYDGVPYGKLRVQVLMHGFQTYGGDYDINRGTMEITIRMKRPEEQYSIYGPNGKRRRRKRRSKDRHGFSRIKNYGLLTED